MPNVDISQDAIADPPTFPRRLCGVFFQLFEQGFLRLCHRISDAMTFAFELAHVDARTAGFAHTVLRSTIQEGAKIAGVNAYA